MAAGLNDSRCEMLHLDAFAWAAVLVVARSFSCCLLQFGKRNSLRWRSSRRREWHHSILWSLTLRMSLSKGLRLNSCTQRSGFRSDCGTGRGRRSSSCSLKATELSFLVAFQMGFEKGLLSTDGIVVQNVGTSRAEFVQSRKVEQNSCCAER